MLESMYAKEREEDTPLPVALDGGALPPDPPSNHSNPASPDLPNSPTLEEMTEKAQGIVLTFTTTSGITGGVPIPFADAPLLVAQQVAMLAAVGGAFELDIEGDVLRNLALTAITYGGTTLLGKAIVTNLIKMIPIGGPIVGGAVSAGTASAITLALGEAYIQVCRAIRNGDLNPDDLATKYGADTLVSEVIKASKKNKGHHHHHH